MLASGLAVLAGSLAALWRVPDIMPIGWLIVLTGLVVLPSLGIGWLLGWDVWGPWRVLLSVPAAFGVLALVYYSLSWLQVRPDVWATAALFIGFFVFAFGLMRRAPSSTTYRPTALISVLAKQ